MGPEPEKNEIGESGDASACPNERSVMPQTLLDELTTAFAKGIYAEREKLAKKLIDAGYNPAFVIIGERYWYDEEAFTMRYECFPMIKDVNLKEA